MSHSTLHPNTSSVVILEGLRNREGEFVTDATVQLTALENRRGDTVGGIDLPLAMDHIEEGRYEGPIPGLAIVPGLYTARIVATSGQLSREWTETVIVISGRA